MGYSSGISKFDLSLIAVEGDESISFSWEYSTDLFKPETLERMTGHFIHLLSQVAEKPGNTIGEMELVTIEERAQLLLEFNGLERCGENVSYSNYSNEKTLYGLFWEQVERVGDEIALYGEAFGISGISGISVVRWLL